MSITEEQAKQLRAPFKPEQIGKLPKPTKRENAKGRCQECGGWHGLPAVHLDYVGHAAITDRLLQVDPEWSWKPMATNESGFPLLDQSGGLWILLTVCGVTRPGYGDETNGKGMKEVIGDALRNSAMRFGVGLDLWSKEDLLADSAGEPQAEHPAGSPTFPAAVSTAVRGEQSSPAEQTTVFQQPDPNPVREAEAANLASDAQCNLIRRLATKLGLDPGDIDSLDKRAAHAQIEELLRLEQMQKDAAAS